jgi:hypothetical protein
MVGCRSLTSRPGLRTTRSKYSSAPVLICGLLIIAASPLFSAVKIQLRHGHPVVDCVYVNGHGPYRFMIDTGTEVNLIETKLARSIGLAATFRSELASAAGVTAVPGGEGFNVSLDSVRSDGQDFLFMDLGAIRDLWPDIQGVLGQMFLSQFDYTLDLRGKSLEFGKFDRTGTRAQFKNVHGRGVVSTSLGDLILDSGVARLVLFGVEPEVRSLYKSELRTLTGSQKIGEASSKRLVIEGRNIWRGDAVAIPHPAESGADGLLPLNLFKMIYVCNSEGYLVFE